MSDLAPDVRTLLEEFRGSSNLRPREMAQLLTLPTAVSLTGPTPPQAEDGTSSWSGLPQVASLYRHPILAGHSDVADALLAGATEVVVPSGTVWNLARGETDGLMLLLHGRAKLIHNPVRYDLDGEETKGAIPSLLGWLGPGCWLGVAGAMELVLGQQLLAGASGARPGMARDEMIRRREKDFQRRFAEVRGKLAVARTEAETAELSGTLRELYSSRRSFLGVMSLTLSDTASVKAVVIGGPERPQGARFLRIPFEHVVQVAAGSDPLQTWLKQQLLLNRMGSPLVHELFERHPLLANLDANQRAYLSSAASYSVLMAPGAPAAPSAMEGSASPPEPQTWLASRRPGGRVALIVEGQAQSYLPGRAKDSQGRLVGTFGPGELIGHEDLVTAADFESFSGEGMPDPSAAQAAFEVLSKATEPARRTDLYLAPGTQLLEWDWRVFRRVLAGSPGTWLGAVRYAQKGCRPQTRSSVPIYAVIGDQLGIGVSTVALGLAVALSRRLAPAQAASGPMTVTPVILVDFDGERTWKERWQKLGFQRTDVAMPQTSDPLTGEARQPVPGTVLLCSHGGCGQCDELPSKIRIAWTRDLQNTVDLISMATWSDDLQRVVVAGASVGREKWAGIRNSLNQSDIQVVWINNEPGAPYQATNELPSQLVRVDRVDAHYRRRARERALEAREEWDKPQDQADLRSEALITTGHMRLPDDVRSAEQLWRCDFDGVWSRVAERGFADCMERLVRIVEGESVGLALSGGGPLGCCQMALLQELCLAKVPIDYLAGSSVGSVVGALFAAGGLPLLDRFLQEHSPTGFEDEPTLKALLIVLRDSPFVRALTTRALWDTEYLGEVMDALGREVWDGEDLPLECTYLPFYPVSANLNSQAPFTSLAGSIGFGIRTSAGMPPSIPGVWRSEERLLDGALVQNVPSNLLRQHGADFLIAANVMKPPLGVTEGRKDRKVYNATVGRVEDVVRGIFLLAWKAGDDQGRLDANHLVDFRTTGAWLIEWWRGWRIREVARQQLVARHVAARIAVHYDKRQDWAENQVDIIDVDATQPPAGGDVAGAPGKPWYLPRRSR